MNTLIEWLKELHSSGGLETLVRTGGTLLACGIIFAETGLLVGFFLPGDSFLITLGVLSNPENPNAVPGLEIKVLCLTLTLSAIAGNQTGYFLGRKIGERIWQKPDSRFFKRKNLLEAHRFMEKRGGFAVIAARFVPILRTFVPFTAGMVRMNYRHFLIVDLIGGVLWINSLLLLGYYLGQTPLANRLDKIILIVILVSILPLLGGALKRFFKEKYPG